ncbi:uncharacterized protein LOC107879102 [Capsicum annuum]|uniref:uncharacterized protein LOC107879102 n=1 Tax=Capsicum annuum TaxID=4072 RepID=UPI0007BFD48D|nr:uncharacterized protein LOC107879102 [Capsicum annuum]
MKKLMSKKKVVKGDTIEVTHGYSAIMDSMVMEKKDDPRAFISPCTIETRVFEKPLCDLGARINLKPFFIYKKLGLNAPTPTSMRLLMEDQSIKKPVQILFDVLVKVDKFVLLVDFVVLDCEMDQEVRIILGCPFLATERAIANLEMGEIKFRVQKDEATFKDCKRKKKSMELQVVSMVDVEIEKVKEGSLEEPP